MKNKKSDDYEYQNEKAGGKQVQNIREPQKKPENLTADGEEEKQGRMENLISKLQSKYGLTYEEAKEKALEYNDDEIKEEEASDQG